MPPLVVTTLIGAPPPFIEATTRFERCQPPVSGFKWGRLDAFGLPATGRTCTPGFRRAPVVVIKGQGECLRTLSRTAEDEEKV